MHDVRLLEAQSCVRHRGLYRTNRWAYVSVCVGLCFCVRHVTHSRGVRHVLSLSRLRARSLSRSLALSLSLARALSLSLIHTHTHTHTHRPRVCIACASVKVIISSSDTAPHILPYIMLHDDIVLKTRVFHKTLCLSVSLSLLLSLSLFLSHSRSVCLSVCLSHCFSVQPSFCVPERGAGRIIVCGRTCTNHCLLVSL